MVVTFKRAIYQLEIMGSIDKWYLGSGLEVMNVPSLKYI